MRKLLALMSVLATAVTLTITPATAQYGTVVYKPFLDTLFTNNLVLQQGQPDNIWGWTTPGAIVSVKLDGKNARRAVADPTGLWITRLPGISGDYTAHTIDVSGPQSVHLTNVLFGEVWICSGQSNMDEGVWLTANAQAEVADANNSPFIRLYCVPRQHAPSPMPTSDGAWNVCNSANIGQCGYPFGGFSAVGYFFGRDLQASLKVPIGLIQSSLGATDAQAWLSAPALDTLPLFQNKKRKVEDHEAEWETKTTDDVVSANAQTDQWCKQYDPATNLTPNPADPSYDDGKWQSAIVPGTWDTRVTPPEMGYLPDYHGAVWFRKTFILSTLQLSQPLTLHMARIHDRDSAWVNGVLIGETVGLELPRAYTVPASIIHAGSNLVTVRVVDDAKDVDHLNGFVCQPSEMYIDVPGSLAISLAGSWKYLPSAQIGTGSPAIPAPPSQPKIGPYTPSMLYNGMIAPLSLYGAKGVIWYQGENNVPGYGGYKELLTALIQDWRSNRHDSKMPFLITQLSTDAWLSADSKMAVDWPYLQEVQAEVAETVPNTGLVVTADIGDGGIHPKDKQDTGSRLAILARSRVYGQPIEYSGPVYTGSSVNGGQITVTFTHADGLAVQDGAFPAGFTIAGADQKWYPATAVLSNNTIVVSSPSVTNPVAVRYDWTNYQKTMGNIMNSAGLPAVPFRTDNWPPQ